MANQFHNLIERVTEAPTVPLGDWLYDVAHRQLIWSQELFQIVGLTSESAPAKLRPIMRLIHPEDKLIWWQTLKQAIQKGTTEAREYRLMRPDGSICYVESHIKAVFGENRQIVQLSGTIRDITARKQAEFLLKEQEQFLRSIYDGVEYSIFVVDVLPDYEFRYVGLNPAHERLTGICSVDLQGKCPEQVFPPATAAAVQQHYEECVRAGNTITYEECLPFQGRETWWLTRLTPLRDHTDRIYRIIGTSLEISDRKRIEAAIQLQTERERLIVQITQHIRQSLHLKQILDTTVSEVRQFLQTDRVIIFRLNEKTSGTIIAESVNPKWDSILGREIIDPCFAESCSLTHHYVQNVADLNTSRLDACYLNLLNQLQVKANLVIPILQTGPQVSDGTSPLHQLPCAMISYANFYPLDLTARDSLERNLVNNNNLSACSLWGLLVAQHCETPRQWQPVEIGLLRQLADQVAIAIQQSELYEKLRIANHELERLATLDGLTQVANRRRFDEYLHQEWNRLAREQKSLSLILCDIDYFKHYNDTHGHLAGDRCLIQVAQAVNTAVERSTDMVARYGGEEFAVVLPNTSISGAEYIARKIQSAIQQCRIPHTVANLGNYLTVSLGLASMVPSAQSVAEDLVLAADTALYQAKTKGRNQYYIYSLFQYLESSKYKSKDHRDTESSK
jgi:diguanylate cyclase (GGDEF)-like protein/PAS domain S-box-containing protein